LKQLPVYATIAKLCIISKLLCAKTRETQIGRSLYQEVRSIQVSISRNFTLRTITKEKMKGKIANVTFCPVTVTTQNQVEITYFALNPSVSFHFD